MPASSRLMPPGRRQRGPPNRAVWHYLVQPEVASCWARARSQGVYVLRDQAVRLTQHPIGKQLFG